VPPLATAVKSAGLPTCDVGTFGTIALKASGPDVSVLLVTTKGKVACASGMSVATLLLRTQTVMAALAAAVVGNQVKLLLELQSCAVA
jgi:hypothetical protein